MSVASIKDFFTNKATVQLKSGQKFEGLLSSINYAQSTVILAEVQDLGNQHDKDCIPHDKKIAEKVFEADNISQIFLQEKHFSEPKKYKKQQFWDAISEPQKKYKPKYENEKKDNYREKKNYENKPNEEHQERGGYKNNRNEGGYRDRDNNYNNQNRRNNEERPRKQEEKDERDYR